VQDGIVQEIARIAAAPAERPETCGRLYFHALPVFGPGCRELPHEGAPARMDGR
jgi:hypothetical protein